MGGHQYGASWPIRAVYQKFFGPAWAANWPSCGHFGIRLIWGSILDPIWVPFWTPFGSNFVTFWIYMRLRKLLMRDREAILSSDSFEYHFVKTFGIHCGAKLNIWELNLDACWSYMLDLGICSCQKATSSLQAIIWGAAVYRPWASSIKNDH